MPKTSPPTPAILAKTRRSAIPEDPNEFFVLLKEACQGAPHSDGLIAEVSRRATQGTLGPRELHQVLLAGDHGKWAAAREAVWAAVSAAPEHAVTILNLEAQRLGGSLGMVEGMAEEGGFTAQASIGDAPAAGQVARGASKKTARRAAALSLLAILSGFPDPTVGAPGPREAVAASKPPQYGDREMEEWLDSEVARDHPDPMLIGALKARRLTVRMLYLLLFEADPRGWAEARAIAWEQLRGNPLQAGGVLTLRTQAERRPSVRYLEFANTTAMAVTEDDRGPVLGEPATAVTWKGARAGAALALIAELIPPPAAQPEQRAGTGNPVGELNERAQVGTIGDLTYEVSVTGPPHQPFFTCRASCVHNAMRVSAAAGGRGKAEAKAAAAAALLEQLEDGDKAERDGTTRPVAEARGPVGITGKLLRAGCDFGYRQGWLELGPLPEPLDGWTASLEQALPGLVTAPGPWGQAARSILAAVAERRVYPSVDADGRDRWLPLPDAPLPEEVPAGFAGDVADLLLRPPGARLILGAVPYASAPRTLGDHAADWADRCAEIANPEPPKPIIIRVHPGTTPHAEIHPEELGEPELRRLRRAARQWPPLERIRRGETAINGAELIALLAAELPGITVEWPIEVARRLTVGTVLRTSGAYSSASAAHVDWRLFLDGEPLTEEEQAAVAAAEGMVRLRGAWVVADPDLLRRPRPREVTGGQALAAALTGQLTLEGRPVPCVAGGELRDLVMRLRQDTDGTTGVPAGLTAVLRDYQRRALDWLARVTGAGFGALLADEMGLGKTLTVIAYHLHRGGEQPTLVVCPASLLANWEREFAKFAPGVTVRRYHGLARDLEGLSPGEVVVTSYGTMTRDSDRLAAMQWELVVADEAQQIKNHRSQAARALRTLPASTRIAVTGTPVENTLSELWAILDWTNPGLFGTLTAFRERYGRAEHNPGGEAAASLARLIGPFMLRRAKSDPGVAPELPEKVVSDRFVTLTDEQAALYRAVTRQTLDQVKASTGMARRGHVLRLLQALRQICNSPAQYLRQPPTGWDPDAESARSGKLQALEELLETALAAGDAALVFTGYVSMGHLIMGHLAARGVAADFLHGGVPVTRRQELVDRFQAGENPVLVLSVRAAGFGLNLTRARHVIHFDRPWNPAVEDQATDRAHRIGQHATVQVHHLIAEGTVEDRIAELLARKRELTEAVLSGGETAFTELDDAELTALVELSGGMT
ncbi:DEAD/DEAH box helicase [Sphaerimonospora cavernae]|uniref:DEAD/DEAH box helicase n=1 Tax=Sphaerimonospora cavernae TaxID=1740611 RepID=A0ABV6U6Y5_9ACTN